MSHLISRWTANPAHARSVRTTGIAAIVKPNSAEFLANTTISNCKEGMNDEHIFVTRKTYLDCNPGEAKEVEFKQADVDLVMPIHP